MCSPTSCTPGGGADDPITGAGFSAYWEYLEVEAGDARAVGAKVLVSHAEADVLLPHCEANDVHLIALRRRNLLRQVVSGQVARQTGIHNSKSYVPEAGRRFDLNMRRVIARLENAVDEQRQHDAFLAGYGRPSIVVYYEDWVQDKAAFFETVFGFLGVDALIPQETTFKRTTPEPLSEIVVNYDRFARLVKKAGCEAFLEE